MIVLLTGILFMFGMAFAQASTEYFIYTVCNKQPCQGRTAKVEGMLLHDFFGSIGIAVLTLFKSLTEGLSRKGALKQLEDISVFWSIYSCCLLRSAT